MKKIVSLVTAVLLMAALLTGCFGGTKEYTCQEMTMTVPSFMKDVSSQSEFKDYTFTLDSSKIAILGIKEKFSDFDGQDMTLEDYAKAVITANKLDSNAIDRAGHDYKYFTYTADTEDGTYKYLVGLYESDEGFWMIQVASLIAKYDETAFFEYLDSVKFA